MGGVVPLFLHLTVSVDGWGAESRIIALEGHAAVTFRSEPREVLEEWERGGLYMVQTRGLLCATGVL
jgi:hypothetical protein